MKANGVSGQSINFNPQAREACCNCIAGLTSATSSVLEKWINEWFTSIAYSVCEL